MEKGIHRSNLLDTVEKMKGLSPTNIHSTIGFDGFIDEILHLVNKRESFDKYSRIKYIKDLGERVLKASGLSTNIEMVPVQTKIGGNGPIMSNACVELGFKVSCIGAFGYPDLNPVFNDLSKKCRVYTISDPGYTNAMEFNDGKLLLTKNQVFNEITWENLKKRLGIKKLAKIIGQSDLIGMVNWTMIPHMTHIWVKLQKHVLPKTELNTKRPFVLVDFADPEKRERKDILEALDVLKGFSAYSKVIFGMNLKEAHEIINVLGLYKNDIPTDIDLETLTRLIAEKMGIYCVLIHPVDRAAAVVGGKYYESPGPYTPTPILTTGAGDNFNAGFCLGQVLGLTIKQSLIIGNGTSGFYVRNGRSPNYTELVDFIKYWSECIDK